MYRYPIRTTRSFTPFLGDYRFNMKTCQSVHFPLDVVTAVSRAATDHEMYHLINFENHTQSCHECITASQSRDFSESICNRGRYYARRLLDVILGAPDGHAYSTSSYRTRYIRVEIPSRFSFVRLLYRCGYRRKVALSMPARAIKAPTSPKDSPRNKKWARGSRFKVTHRTRKCN